MTIFYVSFIHAYSISFVLTAIFLQKGSNVDQAQAEH